MSSNTKGSVTGPLYFGIVTVPRLIVGTLILAGIAINFANVIGRYIFLSPVIWAEEIMIYIMVWMVFIGAILVSYDGQHLRMDFFSIMLPSPFKEIINTIATVSLLAVCLFVIPANWTVVEMMWNNNQMSVVSEVPMVVPHFALLFGFAMIFVAVAVRFRAHVTGSLTTGANEIVAKLSVDPDDEPAKN